MKRLLLAFVVAACAVSSEAAALRRHEAGAGETIEIGYGAGGQDPDPDPAYKGNKFSCFYDLHDGGTLKWRKGEVNSTIWNQVVATNGLAVIDVTEFPNTANPTFCAGFWTDGGKGTIRIKGKTSITIGSSTSFNECGALSIPNLEFVDENDQPVSGTINFNTYVNLVDPPANCTWSGTAECRLAGGAPVFSGETVNSPFRRTYIGNAAAVGADQTVAIGANKLLGFWPGDVTCDDQSFDSSVAKPFRVRVNSRQMTASFPVSLGTGAVMVFSNTTSSAAVTFGGSVTGSGAVVVDKNRTGDVLAGAVGVPVVLRSGATLTLANGASVARLEPEDDTTLLRIGEGSVTLADMAGTVNVTGEGADVSTLVLGSMPSGATLVTDGTVTISFNGGDVPPNGTLVGESDGKVIYRFGNADGVNDGTGLMGLRTPYDAYQVVGAGVTYENLPQAANVRAGEGTTVTVRTQPAGGETFTLSLAGGTFKVGSPDAWKADVSYWFDFSDATTLRRIGEGTTTDYMNENFIERCVDGRQPNATYSLWNRRLYMKDGTLSYANSVYPIPQWNAKDGLTYLSMDAAGSSRRLPLSVGTGYNTYATLPVQLVVMVFGSQNGGGYAMVGTEGGVFGRTGTTWKNDAMTTNGDHDIWLDGEKVDPTTQKFNGGWQIVSIAMDGVGFRGLGFQTDLGGNRGGQNYGEVLIFTEEVSELTRCEAEAYLAKKWKIAGFSYAALERARAAVQTTVNASGTGTIDVTDCNRLVLGGNFAGTVNLSGGSLSVRDVPVPYTPETLPKTNLEGWYDPDYRPTLWCRGDYVERKKELPENKALRALYDRNNPEPDAGEGVVLGLGSRMPYVVPQALGFGPERNWVDFDNLAAEASGNNLRICAHDPSKEYADIVVGMDLKDTSIGTGFIVIDSSRPRFTPIQSAVGGAPGDIRSREQDCTTVWSPSTAAKVREGETRLNGVTVDQTKGFNKCPEVLAFRPSENATAAVFGNYIDTENTNTTDYALLMGEVLLYSEKLSDADTQRIEGYLMRKWLGLVPETCVDVSAATIAGTGTVEISDFAKVPKFDAGFEGVVSVAAGAATGVFEVTIDPETDTVTGALIATNATVTLPAACTIRVTVTSKPGHPDHTDRTWTVFACKELSAEVDWTLEFAGTIGAPKVKFVQVGNRIDVVSPTTGMTIIVK